MGKRRDENLELLFEKALKHYASLIKSRCRAWENNKVAAEDLFSESLVVLMRITQHHSHLGVESREFRNLLMRSVKNRIIDLLRAFSTEKRDKLLEVAYSSGVDDGQIAEAWSSNTHSATPEELVEAFEIAKKLEAKLNEIDRRMLYQLLDPNDELLEKARSHEKVTVAKCRRRSNGAKTDIPVAILGSHVGLSYKQALSSLERIRRTLSILLSEI